MKKILHVTECYAGGVSRAIKSRVAALPEYEHYLLWSGEEPPKLSDGFSEIKELPRGFISRLKSVGAEAKRLGADLVHAHSSWAGVYSRVLRIDTPVVYEPHCFKFDDPGLPKLVKFAVRQAEAVLARRTDLFGVLSSHEMSLVQRIRPGANAVMLPNTPTLTPIGTNPMPDQFSKIVMIGRISLQKDPQFFLDVVDELRRLKIPLEICWVGDGEVRLRAKLERAGVRVTGWLEPDGLKRELQGAIYVHSAAYEGFPLSVLDAAAVGAPIAVRSIAPFRGTGLLQADAAKGIAALVVKLMSREEFQSEALAANASLLSTHNVENLRIKLRALYASVNR